MRNIIILILSIYGSHGISQEAKDLFRASDVQFYWLGVDFSHVKLIGDFAEFISAGDKNAVEIRNRYFPKWNNLILAEPSKYDIKGMLRKGELVYEIGMISNLNANAPIEDMEAYNNPKYSRDDIAKWVESYPTEEVSVSTNKAIGIVFIAEALNKSSVEAYYHFVAMNLNTKEILIHDRLRGEPAGFGLRNYWAGSIYKVIKIIEKTKYKSWKAKYK